MGRCGDRGVVGEEDQGVMETQLGAPLGEGHVEICPEQPGQRAAAGTDVPAELGERAVVAGIGLQQAAQVLELRGCGRRQMKWLMG